MSKLPLFPEMEEYIDQCKWEEENYPKSRYAKEYDKLELEFIRNLYLEEYHREPTYEEIEEQKIELMKIKYLIDIWFEEYFEKVEKEHKESLEKK